MKWNYFVGVCLLVLAFSVFNHSPVSAIVSAIGLAIAIKVGGAKLAARMGRKR